MKENNNENYEFEIITKENLFNEDYGFTDLSFKLVYCNDPLFSHVIKHINEYLEKFPKNSDKKIIQCLEDIINYDGFSEAVLNKILLNGIPEALPCLRPLIWRALIGFYPLKELSNWEKISTKTKSKYKAIVHKYNYYPDNIKDDKDKKTLEQIDKDLPRTRFDVPFFASKNANNDKENNSAVLRRMLFFYAKQNEDVGYVQGMNEIIAIIFYLFSKDDNPFMKEYTESDSYFTFVKLMSQIKEIFQLDDINYSELFITLQIKEIKKILKKIEPELFRHFEDVSLEIDNFVMRWILVLFAQEFSIDVAINFWDRLFTQKDKMKFICYISATIIRNNKEKIMKMAGEEIMEWAQQLQNKMNEIDVTNLVIQAIEIQNVLTGNESNNISLK